MHISISFSFGIYHANIISQNIFYIEMFSVIWCLVFLSWVLLCLMLCFKYKMFILLFWANSLKLTLFFHVQFFFMSLFQSKDGRGILFGILAQGGGVRGLSKDVMLNFLQRRLQKSLKHFFSISQWIS